MADHARFGEAAAVDQAAKVLAEKHYEVEDGLTHIFRIRDRATVTGNGDEQIRLLEVNANTVPSGVMPLHFAPAPASGVPFPSVIVEVTPDEYTMLVRRELTLPEGWEICEEFPRPARSEV